VSDIRKTKSFRDAAARLREEAALRGVTLVAGEVEDILADRVAAVATMLGVSERTALTTYLPEHAIVALAETLGTLNTQYTEATTDPEPVAVDVANLGRVVAALGMALKLAVDHAGKTEADAFGIATDCADALVGLGAQLRAADGARQVTVRGPALAYTRRVLVATVEHVRDGRWACPCRSQHGPGRVCTVQKNLTSDLGLVGGWIGDADAPPEGS